MKKYKVGIIGCTGMWGSVSPSAGKPPWFDVKLLAASPRSAGKTYEEAVGGPLVDGIPHARGDEIHGGSGRFSGGGHRWRGGFRFLCGGYAQSGNQGAGGGLRQGGMPGDLQQQRQPRHAGRSHDHSGAQPGARRGHPLSARPSGDQTGLHRGEIQLLPAKLCSRSLPFVPVGGQAGAGLHLSGPFPARAKPLPPGRRWWTI